MNQDLRQGIFITLEGIEGAGKTTHMPYLEAYIRKLGWKCLRTREPGGTQIGKKIRAILLDPSNTQMDPLCELLLYGADRAQHLAQVINPAISRGDCVVCDRFFDATTAYQGYARELSLDLISVLHKTLLGVVAPDLTILFDLPASVGLSRARDRIAQGMQGMSESRFEEEELAFHEKVRQGYLSLAQANTDRFIVISAEGSPETVRDLLTCAVDDFFKKRKTI